MKRLLPLLLLLAGCAQSQVTGVGNFGGSVAISPVATISVSVTCASYSINSGGTSQCSATVTGSGDQTGTWSITGCTGGNISVGGLVTAGNGALTCVPKFTANADNTKFGTQNITVTAVSVTVSPPAASVNQSATQLVDCAVSGAANTSCNFTCALQGGGACAGGISPASGTSTTYTAPGSGTPVDVVTGTSAQDNSKTGTATLTVVASGGGGVSPIFSWLGASATDLTSFTDIMCTTPASNCAAAIDDPTGGGKGKVISVTFGPKAAGTTSIDINNGPRKGFTGTRHLYNRFWIYFANPETDGARCGMRKMTYFHNSPGSYSITNVSNGDTLTSTSYKYVAYISGNVMGKSATATKGASYTGVTAYVDAAARTITRTDAGSFVSDGVTTVRPVVQFAGFANGANNAHLQVSSVAAKVLTFVVGTSLVDEGSVGSPVSVTYMDEFGKNASAGQANGFTYGTWHCIEHDVDAGTIPNVDGSRRLWIDGTAAVSETNTGVYYYETLGANSIGATDWGRQIDSYDCSSVKSSFTATASRDAGGTTSTFTTTGVSSQNNGKDIIVTGCSDSSFNGVLTVSSTTSTTFVAPNAGTGNATATACKIVLQAHETRYITDIELYDLGASYTYADVPTRAGCRQ